MGNGFLPDFIYNPFDNVFSDPMTADLAFVNWQQQMNQKNDDKLFDDEEDEFD